MCVSDRRSIARRFLVLLLVPEAGGLLSCLDLQSRSVVEMMDGMHPSSTLAHLSATVPYQGSPS
jgi:hypothetical protein